MAFKDGVLVEIPEENLLYLDSDVIKQFVTSDENNFYWGRDFKFNIKKEYLIDIHLSLGIPFSPMQLRRLRNIDSDNLELVKINGSPGWFRINSL